jgi:hypothetical protein
MQLVQKDARRRSDWLSAMQQQTALIAELADHGRLAQGPLATRQRTDGTSRLVRFAPKADK